jgi:hypothetical protein
MKKLSLIALIAGLTLGPATGWADIPPEKNRARPVPRPVRPPTPDTGKPDTVGDTDSKAAPVPSIKLAPSRPARLPDGQFAGAVAGLGVRAELELTIVSGFIVEAIVRREGGQPVFDLRSIATPNALGLNLRGNAGRETLKVSGEFFDAERGHGTIEGVLGTTRVSGTWLLKRR